MATTKASFYTEVLRELKVVGPNGTASAEDTQRVTDAYTRVWDMLFNRDLVTWQYADSLPDWAVLPLTKMVSFAVAPRFAIKGERLLMLKQEGEIDAERPSWAERQLRKQVAKKFVPSTLSNNYF